jgi:hypothetical protein
MLMSSEKAVFSIAPKRYLGNETNIVRAVLPEALDASGS